MKSDPQASVSQKFTQKWSLLTLFEPVAEGTEFCWKDYPLHITHASVFAVDWDKSGLFDKLSDLLASQKPVIAIAEEDDYWGDSNEYHVVKIRKTPELMRLHNDIHQVLLQAGAVFNEPQYEGDGYIPHSTIQKHARLRQGDAVKISEITVLDMLPNNDGYQRKILQTIKFGG